MRASHGAVFESIAPKGSRITDMADRAGMTKQSMGQFVHDLKEQGYVERRRDPSDGRANLIRLTARGRKAVSAAFEGLQQLQANFERTVGHDRAELLHTLLAELVDALTKQEAPTARSGPQATETLASGNAPSPENPQQR